MPCGVRASFAMLNSAGCQDEGAPASSTNASAGVHAVSGNMGTHGPQQDCMLCKGKYSMATAQLGALGLGVGVGVCTLRPRWGTAASWGALAVGDRGRRCCNAGNAKANRQVRPQMQVLKPG